MSVLTNGPIATRHDRADRGRSGRLGITLAMPARRHSEAGFSARSALELTRATGVTVVGIDANVVPDPAAEDQAVELQRLLVERGQHRATSIPNLLIAAAAELNQRTVLHLDEHFDLTAALTAQPVERLRVE